MPTTHKTALELYLKAYLKTLGVRNIGRVYAQKALALIDEKLGIPCCTDPTATIDLHTRLDNNFSVMVKSLLAVMPKIGNVKSLQRSKKLIEDYLYCCNSAALDAITVDDTANTLNFTPIAGISDLSSYEYTTDGGVTYSPVTTNPVGIGDVTKEIGTVGVRLKQGSYNGKYVRASKTVYNTTAFNAGVAPSAPTTDVVDDTAKTFSWTDTGGKTFSDAEYTINGGTSYSSATAKPQPIVGAHAIGQVGVRYKAAGGNPPSSTLFSTVAFT